MANLGSSDATTSPQNSKSSGTILVVILVVVLSILALCVIGIAVIVYSRRRARRYVRLRQNSEDGTAVEASAFNSRSDTPWSSFLRRINILNQSSSPVPYQPIQLPDTRHSAKVGNRFGDPNIPRSPPITDTSSSAPKVPTPMPNPTPASTSHRVAPQTPIRSVTVPPFFRVYQEVKRLAPPPENPITRPPPPVRAPTAPINLPSRNPTPPSHAPMAVINIVAPPGFTIDDTPTSSMVGPTAITNKQRRPNGLRYDSNHNVDDGEDNADYLRSIPWYPRGPRSAATTQDSDSVVDQPSTPGRKRRKSIDEPMSPVSPRTDDSATTSGSIAGSSRPPTLTFKKMLNFASTRKPVLPSLDLPGKIPFSSQPHSRSRMPSREPHTRQPNLHSQSPPHYQTQFNTSRTNYQQPHHAPRRPNQTLTLPQISQSQSHRRNPSQLSESSRQDRQPRSHQIHRSPEPIRRPLPTPDTGDAAQAPRLDDYNLGAEGRRNDEVAGNRAQSSLFPRAVVGAGYRNKPNTVPTPLPLANAGSRQYDPTAAPPPTPYSWAFSRTNRI